MEPSRTEHHDKILDPHQHRLIARIRFVRVLFSFSDLLLLAHDRTLSDQVAPSDISLLKKRVFNVFLAAL